MLNKQIEVIVIGGGIVGLATSLCILQKKPGTRLVLIEKEPELACHQTGHNSGVIHSGLYYKPGSLKAINCQNGYKQLIKFCQDENINFDICGKIVVATSTEEITRLNELHRRGVANGLDGIKFIGPEEIKEREPYCNGVRGLFVPQTGIIDYKLVALKYAEKLKSLGGEIILGEEITDIRRRGDIVEVSGRSATWTAKSGVVCAGLQSDRLALKTEQNLPLRILPFRGEYFKLKPSGQQLVNHLIYPVPDPAFPFLGVHFTRMINGEIECGPNAVFAFGREAYKKTAFNVKDSVEALLWPGFRKVVRKYWRTGMQEYYRSFSKQAFVKALQKLIPEIRSEHIEACESGIRAQACDINGNLLDDFNFREDGNLYHICNAPSPAATASLSIGQTIASKVLQKL